MTRIDPTKHTIDRYQPDPEATCYNASSFDQHSFVLMAQAEIVLNLMEARIADPSDPLHRATSLDRVVPIPRAVYDEPVTTVDVRICTDCGVKLLTLPGQRMAELEAAGVFRTDDEDAAMGSRE